MPSTKKRPAVADRRVRDIAARQPGRRRPKPSPQADVGLTIKSIDELMLDVRRRYAAYGRMVDCYQSVTGTLPPGARINGLPLFAFKASVDGVSLLDVVQDMREVAPQHQPHVFAAFAQAQAGKLLQATARLKHEVDSLYAEVAAACGEQAQAQPSAGKSRDEVQDAAAYALEDAFDEDGFGDGDEGGFDEPDEEEGPAYEEEDDG